MKKSKYNIYYILDYCNFVILGLFGIELLQQFCEKIVRFQTFLLFIPEHFLAIFKFKKAFNCLRISFYMIGIFFGEANRNSSLRFWKTI